MPRKDETIPPNAHRDRIKISQKNARCRGAEGDERATSGWMKHPTSCPFGVFRVSIPEKPPYFCEDFSSLVAVWWAMGDSNLRPPACKLCNQCFSLSQVNHSPQFDGNLGGL